MDVSIAGASGGCGREIVTQIVQQRLLESREAVSTVRGYGVAQLPADLHTPCQALKDILAGF